MRKRRALMVIAALGFSVAGVAACRFNAARIARFLDIDSCLDHGGCWDYVHDTCSDEQANCQTPAPDA